MENDGIQRLLKAEDEAAAVIQRAREQRTQRLRQAATEAEKSANALKVKLESEFKDALNQKDMGDSSNANKVKSEAEKEMKEIDANYVKNQQAVIDLLLFNVTSVKLQVDEALKQSLITKHEQGEA